MNSLCYLWPKRINQPTVTVGTERRQINWMQCVDGIRSQNGIFTVSNFTWSRMFIELKWYLRSLSYTYLTSIFKRQNTISKHQVLIKVLDVVIIVRTKRKNRTKPIYFLCLLLSLSSLFYFSSLPILFFTKD